MRKGALIGFGRVAELAHAGAWAKTPGASLVAVAEADPARLRAARNLLPGARAYESLESLLDGEEELDFVDIATPPTLHGPQALAALRRGLHVLCEKPLSLDRAEFEALRSQAERADRVVFSVHNWKHAPLLAKLGALMRDGAVGSPRHLEWHVLRSQPAAAAGPGGNWRTDPRLAGGGILVDHGWHAAYLLAWLLGGRPLRVWGALKRPESGGAEDEATFIGEFPLATGLAHMSWRAISRGHFGVVYGDSGRIDILDDRLILASGSEAPRTFRFPEPLSAGSAHQEWFAGTVADFLRAMDDRAARRENLLEAEACLDVLENVYSPEEPKSIGGAPFAAKPRSAKRRKTGQAQAA